MEGDDKSAQGREKEASSGRDLQETIPFQLGSQIKLRSLTSPPREGKTRVVGILDGAAILVEDPVFEKGEQITGRIGGEIQCAFFLEGCVYKFRSRFGQVLINDVVCIDYPKHFESQQLRQHPRVKVNLETESVIGDDKKLINGDIRDISKGGCCMELPGIIPLTRGTPVRLTFQLPNEELIEDLECTVMNMRSSNSGKKTFIGLSFKAPKPEMAKVRKFCEMCMYFKT